MPNVRLVPENFMEMVAALPAAKLDDLYNSPWICQAVVRSLPPVSKQYVLRLLFVEVALSSKAMQDWALTDSLMKHKVAIDKLEQLRVIIETSERKKETTFKLNPKLQKQIQAVLRTGRGVPRESMPASFAAKVPSLGDLENYASKQWEAVLLQLVSSASADVPTLSMNSSLVETFKRAGLLTAKGREPPRITDTGFQFLLMDTNSQIWEIVREYVTSAKERGMDSAELISFLLELSFLHVGEPYNLNTLSLVQQNVIKELAALGLLQIQSGSRDRWYVPTKLASNLAASIAESSNIQAGEGFIVVETNFRVYAYTTSKLHSEILRLFVRLEYQLPNLVVGSLTKESVNLAFTRGVLSDQIISFLSKHAHPHAAKKTPVLPETVTDQIRLWENDRNRVEMSPAYLYKDFSSVETFNAVLRFARDNGGLLWEDAVKRRLIAKSERHQEMNKFIHHQSSQTQRRRPNRDDFTSASTCPDSRCLMRDVEHQHDLIVDMILWIILCKALPILAWNCTLNLQSSNTVHHCCNPLQSAEHRSAGFSILFGTPPSQMRQYHFKPGNQVARTQSVLPARFLWPALASSPSPIQCRHPPDGTCRRLGFRRLPSCSGAPLASTFHLSRPAPEQCLPAELIQILDYDLLRAGRGISEAALVKHRPSTTSRAFAAHCRAGGAKAVDLSSR